MKFLLLAAIAMSLLASRGEALAQSAISSAIPPSLKPGAAGLSQTPQGGLRMQANPFVGIATVTPGTAFTPGNAIGFIITTAGTVTFTMANGSTITMSLPTNTELAWLPLAVKLVTLGTAVGTFYSLN